MEDLTFETVKLLNDLVVRKRLLSVSVGREQRFIKTIEFEFYHNIFLVVRAIPNPNYRYKMDLKVNSQPTKNLEPFPEIQLDFYKNERLQNFWLTKNNFMLTKNDSSDYYDLLVLSFEHPEPDIAISRIWGDLDVYLMKNIKYI